MKVWSKPKVSLSDDQLVDFFGDYIECRMEMVHICKYDTEIEAVSKFRGVILNYEKMDNSIKVPKMELLLHSDETILKMIDKLSNSSACGPDGDESELIKRLRVPMSRLIGRNFLPKISINENGQTL